MCSGSSMLACSASDLVPPLLTLHPNLLLPPPPIPAVRSLPLATCAHGCVLNLGQRRPLLLTLEILLEP